MRSSGYPKVVVAVALCAVLLASSACEPGAPEAAPAVSVGPSCLTALPAPTPVPALTAGPAGRMLPDPVLHCLAGGEPARLSQVRGPAIINLWASWCLPCREELPAFQRYAARAGNRVNLVGVITGDRDREAQLGMIGRLKLQFPMVEDPESKLLYAVEKASLPVTLFVAGDGRIAYLYQARALDEATIELFAERYLGVVLA